MDKAAFESRIQSLHDIFHEQDMPKFNILVNAINIIATPPEPHQSAQSVPSLQEAIQTYYREIAEEEPPSLDLSDEEQAAFDAVRDLVVNNFDWFQQNNADAGEVIEGFAEGMRGGSRKRRSTRSTKRSTRRKVHRKKRTLRKRKHSRIGLRPVNI